MRFTGSTAPGRCRATSYSIFVGFSSRFTHIFILVDLRTVLQPSVGRLSLPGGSCSLALSYLSLDRQA